MSELYRLVRELRTWPKRSRNRHFDELSQPIAQRARKVARRLDGLARELRSCGQIEVRRHDTGVLVTLDHPALKLHRKAFLTDEEHALLSDDPALAAVLLVG